MFSSVEEDPAVLCRIAIGPYRLAKNIAYLLVSRPQYVLELIQQIDPNWIAELRHLIHHGSCEFIGSGYAQLIGPCSF